MTKKHQTKTKPNKQKHKHRRLLLSSLKNPSLPFTDLKGEMVKGEMGEKESAK